MQDIHLMDSDNNVRLTPCDSRSELDASLVSYGGARVINREQDNARFFWSIEWASRGQDEAVHLGLAAAGHGITPQICTFDDGKKLLIGVDSRVVGIQNDVHVVFNHELDGVFFEFLAAPGFALPLVIHELGVVALHPDGDVAWQHAADGVLSSWTINGNVLEVQDSERRSFAVDLTNGQLLDR